MEKYNVHNLYNGQFYEKEFMVTENMGELYAQISQDYNPIHLDAEYAKTSRFGQTIVHGMVMGSFI